LNTDGITVKIGIPIPQKEKPAYDVAKYAGGFPIRILHTLLWVCRRF